MERTVHAGGQDRGRTRPDEPPVARTAVRQRLPEPTMTAAGMGDRHRAGELVRSVCNGVDGPCYGRCASARIPATLPSTRQNPDVVAAQRTGADASACNQLAAARLRDHDRQPPPGGGEGQRVSAVEVGRAVKDALGPYW